MTDCLFCNIANGKIPCKKIFEDEKCLAFLDIAGDIAGHTLVVPKKHIQNFLDCPPDLLAHLTSVAQKIALHFVQNCKFEGVNILTNAGASAQQAVMHFHIHILPRKSGDVPSIFAKLDAQNFDLDALQNTLKLN